MSLLRVSSKCLRSAVAAFSCPSGSNAAAFVATTTLVAGWKSITDNFWPLSQRPETAAQGYINTALTAILMAASVVILVDSVRRWTRGRRAPAPGAAQTPVAQTP